MSEFFSKEFAMTHLLVREKNTDLEVRLIDDVLGDHRSKILDLGCGTGRHAICLAKKGHYVTGVDINQPYLNIANEEAQKENVDVEWINIDFRKMDFCEDFDAVICIYTTFGYYVDRENENILGRIVSSIRPGGKLFLEVLNRDFPEYAHKYTREEFHGDISITKTHALDPESSCLKLNWRYFKSGVEFKKSSFSVRLYSLHELIMLFERNGLSVEEYWSDAKKSPYTLHGKKIFLIGCKR